MIHTTRSIEKAFRAANMVPPDEDMAAIIAESMRASGYPDDQLRVALNRSKPAQTSVGTRDYAMGGQ